VKEEADLFNVLIELSFPPDNKTLKSTAWLCTLEPVGWEVAQRMQNYFEHHAVPVVLRRVT
jgi:hypothetical protein